MRGDETTQDGERTHVGDQPQVICTLLLSMPPPPPTPPLTHMQTESGIERTFSSQQMMAPKWAPLGWAGVDESGKLSLYLQIR